MELKNNQELVDKRKTHQEVVRLLMISACEYISNKMNRWIKTDVDSTFEDNTDYIKVVQSTEYLISLAINTKAVIEKSQTFGQSLAAFDLLIAEMRKNYEIVDDIERKVLLELRLID